MKNSHCSYCGSKFDKSDWPRHCSTCESITYSNPLPVALALLPVLGHPSGEEGILVVRRNINPQKGKLALPGGYVETGESWREAVVRELYEETGLRFPADGVRTFDVKDGRSTVLLFGLIMYGVHHIQVDAFEGNEEVSELDVITEPQELAFPAHTEVVTQIFELAKEHGSLSRFVWGN